MSRLRLALLAAVAFIALAPAAYADDTWGDGIEVMDEADLEAHRGGLSIGGLNIDFGAVITTTIDGIPVMTTSVNWTDVGAVVEQTVGDVGQQISELTEEQRAALGINGLPDANGIVITDTAGVTALVHNITEGSLQSIIINNATGRDISQDIDVTLTLPGFEGMQGVLLTQRLGLRLEDDMRGFIFGGG